MAKEQDDKEYNEEFDACLAANLLHHELSDDEQAIVDKYARSTAQSSAVVSERFREVCLVLIFLLWVIVFNVCFL